MPALMACALLGWTLVALTADASAPSDRDSQPGVERQAAVGTAATLVSLAIRTLDDRIRFRQGEIITVQLVFEAEPGSALILPGSLHTVVVEPGEGVTAPLADFLTAFGIVGSVLGTLPEPTGGPVVVRIDVNEQWRFDQPGEYALHVRSEYALIPSSGAPSRFAQITSNVLPIQILPPGPPLTTAQAVDAPARILRFLDTREAAIEMARRLVGAEDDGNRIGTPVFESRYGLLSTPHRAFIVAEMEQMLDTATGAVGPAFLDTLARLAALLEHPVTPGDGDPQLPQRRYESFLRALQRYSATAVLAAERGTPRDRAIALAAALEHAATRGPGSGGAGLDLASVHAIAAQLPALFHHLPHDTQRAMLWASWRWIARGEMVPVLQRLLRARSPSDTSLADLALVRLAELAPDQAGRLALEELAQPRGRFDTGALSVALDGGRLPEGELDALLASALAVFGHVSAGPPGCSPDTRGCNRVVALSTVAGLVERHGSVRILADVQQVYALLPAGFCGARVALLGYVLRVAPEMGERLVREAVAGGRRTCAIDVFETLSRTSPARALENVGVAHLYDPDWMVAAAAARALAHVGRDRGRDALWRRLEAWHHEWKNRPEVPQDQQPGPMPPDGSRMLGQALVDAVLQGVHWRTTPADLRRLESLCLDEGCRHGIHARSMPPSDTTDVTARLLDAGVGFHMGMRTFASLDALKAHLAQYPEGTVFGWTRSDAISDPMEAEILADLQAFAAKRRIVIAPR